MSKKSIVGCIPIGVTNSMDLPYPKEMLPHPHREEYVPIVKLLIEQMLLGGCNKVVMVHNGKKQSSLHDYFRSDRRIIHLHLKKQAALQKILPEVYAALDKRFSFDQYILAFGDAFYCSNPFPRMAFKNGCVTAIAEVPDNQKLDRYYPSRSRNFFNSVSKEHDPDSSSKAWCALGLSKTDIETGIDNGDFEKVDSIAGYLNTHPFSTVDAGYYYDTGTWVSYLEFANQVSAERCLEVEKKYQADQIKTDDFNNFVKENTKPLGINCGFQVESTDYYFNVENNDSIEFVRFRSKGDSEKSRADLTVKSYNSGASTRTEVTVPLPDNVSTDDVLLLLTSLGARPAIEITKKCEIYTGDNCELVLYDAWDSVGKKRFLEIETKNNASFSILGRTQKMLEGLAGFQPTSLVRESKFAVFSSAER